MRRRETHVWSERAVLEIPTALRSQAAHDVFVSTLARLKQLPWWSEPGSVSTALCCQSSRHVLVTPLKSVALRT